jgi:hypothetical protein
MKLRDALLVNIGLTTLDTKEYINTNALLDSGATGMFMDKTFTIKHKLAKEIMVYNVDDTKNLGGSITKEVDLNMHYKKHKERVTFKITKLGKMTIIIV